MTADGERMVIELADLYWYTKDHSAWLKLDHEPNGWMPIQVVRVTLKDGREDAGQLSEYYPRDGWFVLVRVDAGHATLTRYMFDDCERAVAIGENGRRFDLLTRKVLTP